jgi:hypothetical protein
MSDNLDAAVGQYVLNVEPLAPGTIGALLRDGWPEEYERIERIVNAESAERIGLATEPAGNEE